MADDIKQVEDSNAKLREEIEAVQQKRREGFAEGEELSRSVTAIEENERLKRVLEDQQRILAREEKARERAFAEATGDAPSLAVSASTPYTYTDQGTVLPDGPNTTDADDDVSDDENQEN